MDAPAIRPAMFEMGERLAQAGYFVILPDMFWRAGPYDPPDIKAARAGDPEAVAIFQKLRGSTGAGRQMTTSRRAWTTCRNSPGPRPTKSGSPATAWAAASRCAPRTFPTRIAAMASFHGGNMDTDDEKSPHRLADRIQAKVLVAGADQDSGFDEAQKDRLTATLKAAGVDAEVSIWEGCRHGWVPTDMAVYNQDGAERHWRELVALFDGVLK